MNISIYQLKNTKGYSYSFMSLDFALNHGFCRDDYEEIYAFTENALLIQDVSGLTNEQLLEIIFRQFNRVTEEDCKRLEFIGFKGHSISVSDVVKIDDEYYYCDSFGWENISKYF